MKNLRRDGYFQKKYGKYTGDKWNSSKLDRKSSRGMIYENEELRLRTININAEVERGQSDIRKLRRENEQLRREIWSLRDEYDRLNKLLKTHKTTENDANNSGSSHTEESDSCDTCKEEEIDDEIIENDECLENKCNKRKQKQRQSKLKSQEIAENYENTQKTDQSTSSSKLGIDDSDDLLILEKYQETISGGNCNKPKENLHVNFDHLSIVSEENLTNSDGNSVQQGDIEQVIIATMPHHGNGNEQQKFIDMQSAEFHRLSDIQSVAPPLSHFENIPYDKMGPIMAHISATSLDDITCSTSTTTTGETVIPANGWDFGVPSYTLHTAKSSDPLKVPSNVSQKSLKHFFSPIKPRNRIEPRHPIETTGRGGGQIQSPSSSSSTATNSTAIRIGPDVFVANALGSPYHRQNLSLAPPQVSGEPVYATVQKSSSSRTVSPLSFQRGGNLEELLSDIETLSNDILQMQLEKQKSFSQEKLFSGDNLSPNRKPYRSEMNLILTYNGSNPVITPITKTSISSSTTALDKTNPYNAEGTPPANLPEPMILFPQNLTYLGFENYNQLPGGTEDGGGGAQTQESGYSVGVPNYSKDYEQIHVATPTVYDVSAPFHSIGYLPAEKDRLKGDIEQGVPLPSPTTISPTATTTSTTGRTVMRRKFFTKHLDDHQGTSRSCDTVHPVAPSTPTVPVPQSIFERSKMTRTESSTSENANCDVQSSSGSETIKRKSRRVSILFKRPDDKVRDKSKDKRTTEENTIANKTIALHSESAINLPTAVDGDVMMTKKSTAAMTHSTPNSPHSGGRRLNPSGNSGQHHHHSHHHHHQHHQQSHHQNERKSSQDSESKEPLLAGSSAGSAGGGGGGGAGGVGVVGGGGQQQQQQQHQQRTKCSRRHSEGTVGPALSASGVLHSSSNHGLHDTYHEPGTSMSERNSNSLASSRESSTSLSMRSQRRKISVSSHNGGKIPWCGCWGNGCV